MGQSPKEYWKAYKQRGKIPVQFGVTWALIQSAIKILKEDKETITHDEEMANFLNEYKLYG